MYVFMYSRDGQELTEIPDTFLMRTNISIWMMIMSKSSAYKKVTFVRNKIFLSVSCSILQISQKLISK